jgi:hypothetical protein
MQESGCQHDQQEDPGEPDQPNADAMHARYPRLRDRRIMRAK